MQLVAPLPQLETVEATIGARPTAAGDGVDISSWIVGGKFAPAMLMVYLESDGSDETVTKPVGGAGGVEIWMYKARKSGTKKWRFVGYLNGSADIPIVAAAGGAMFELDFAAIGSRLALAGAAVGAHPPTYYFEPLEVWIDTK